ncbi:hypothetical protein JAAARDRAFT_301607 [Jaapia argillacea MUCL 33604]|uniref:Uncharacterized protein n=1 Tax=Jaapia argillacea MUCL 33604 TaxID=933084 RepID=A0A067PSI9_9AGAM|nr:hypothetical protein JAAARDRAFT_301607 [Jaapia argillacea MUCL 33604]
MPEVIVITDSDDEITFMEMGNNPQNAARSKAAAPPRKTITIDHDKPGPTRSVKVEGHSGSKKSNVVSSSTAPAGNPLVAALDKAQAGLDRASRTTSTRKPRPLVSSSSVSSNAVASSSSTPIHLKKETSSSSSRPTPSQPASTRSKGEPSGSDRASASKRPPLDDATNPPQSKRTKIGPSQPATTRPAISNSFRKRRAGSPASHEIISLDSSDEEAPPVLKKVKLESAPAVEHAPADTDLETWEVYPIAYAALDLDVEQNWAVKVHRQENSQVEADELSEILNNQLNISYPAPHLPRRTVPLPPNLVMKGPWAWSEFLEEKYRIPCKQHPKLPLLRSSLPSPYSNQTSTPPFMELHGLSQCGPLVLGSGSVNKIFQMGSAVVVGSAVPGGEADTILPAWQDPTGNHIGSLVLWNNGEVHKLHGHRRQIGPGKWTRLL